MSHDRPVGRALWLAMCLVALFGFGAAPCLRAAEVASPDSLAPDSVLTLAWLERTALARNPSLAAMREAEREARARAEQAGALEDPMFDGMLAPRSLRSRSVEPAWRVGITQQFPIFGQRGLRRRAAHAAGEIAASEFETARLDLLREVREAYFDDYRVSRGHETNRDWLMSSISSRLVS